MSPDFKATWTPGNVNAPQKIGLFAFQNAASLPGITSIIINHQTNDQGYQIGNSNDLVTISFPFLTSLSNVTNAALLLYLDTCPNLVNILLPVLATCGNGLPGNVIQITNNFGLNGLLTLTFPSLVTCNAWMQIAGNSFMRQLVMPAFLPTNTMHYDFSGNNLRVESVNGILARAVASAGYVSGTLDLSGGTNAAPSGQGIADKATLIGRGVTVNTN